MLMDVLSANCNGREEMKLKNISMALALIISSCAPAGPLGGQVINIHEGKDIYQVQELPGGHGYAASKIQYWGFIDPRDYQQNVKEIEKVTHCKVIRETIVNEGQVTRAAVDCTKVKHVQKN